MPIFPDLLGQIVPHLRDQATCAGLNIHDAPQGDNSLQQRICGAANHRAVWLAAIRLNRLRGFLEGRGSTSARNSTVRFRTLDFKNGQIWAWKP